MESYGHLCISCLAGIVRETPNVNSVALILLSFPGNL